ncbi:anthrone oxygenase family protein [Microlunatus flavus]|uniref:Uncharacterized membrane protein n=1 Tax=Microlunatus flavus TaxID=1036181 RepID=A0A1H9ARJ3_9ACTN|nr:anthrone oxygenase family protein [Microlunatus flavus]SEP79340.1 Uncharacterized membrane protein [Microlunatus flavus]
MLTGGPATVATALAALGSALVAGIFLAFSAFVMRALQALDPASALAAMQQVNRFAPRAGLLVPLLGTALLCAVLGVVAVVSLATGPSARGWLVLVGCLLHLLAFGVTSGYHVPHNDALALVDPHAAGAAAAWRAYAGPWLVWNHVRTAAAALGAAALLAALGAGRQVP